MTKYIDIGDTIDGNVLSGNTRKFGFKTLKKHPVTNKIVQLYSCDRNSSVVVEKEADNSLYGSKVGDSLNADAIVIYASVKSKIKTEVKEGVTHRHGATIFKIDGYASASIKTPLQNLLKKLGYTAEYKIE